MIRLTTETQTTFVVEIRTDSLQVIYRQFTGNLQAIYRQYMVVDQLFFVILQGIDNIIVSVVFVRLQTNNRSQNRVGFVHRHTVDHDSRSRGRVGVRVRRADLRVGASKQRPSTAGVFDLDPENVFS